MEQTDPFLTEYYHLYLVKKITQNAGRSISKLEQTFILC